MKKDRFLGRKIGPYQVVEKQTNSITHEVEYVCKVGNYQVNFNKKEMLKLDKMYSARE